MSTRSLSPQRQRIIPEIQLKRQSPKTIQVYVIAVWLLASHCGCSPKEMSPDEVRKLAYSSVKWKLAGIRFLYRRVLGPAKCYLRIDRNGSGKLHIDFVGMTSFVADKLEKYSLSQPHGRISRQTLAAQRHS